MINDFKTEKLIVPINKVTPNKWNPNFQDKFMFNKQKQSVSELGFLGSILVRRVPKFYDLNRPEIEFEIMDGEHRWKAAKEHEYTEIPIEVIIGEVSDSQAQLLTILLNNLRGKDDVFKRAKILEALDEGQLGLLPMTEEEISNERKLVKFDFGKYDEGKDIPEREHHLVIVLPFNKDEAAMWIKAKETLMKIGHINEKNKKQQDIQLVVFLLKEFFQVHIGSSGEDQKEFIVHV